MPNKEENIKVAREVDNEFSLYDKSGKQKSLGWSIASMVVGILSFLLSAFGWTGIIFGICAIVFAIVAWVKLGYFNAFIIIGIICGIFGTVLGVFFSIFSIFLPDIMKWIQGIAESNIENV